MATIKVSGIATKVTWVPTSFATWITVSRDASTDATAFTLEVTANTSTDSDRTGTAKVVTSDGAEATINVTQYKKSAPVLNPNTLNFNSKGTPY